MKSIILEDSNTYLYQAVNFLADIVKVTLGPRGNNVLIFNKYNKGYLTKDGVTVAKNTFHKDEVVNGIMEVVKEASINTAKSAGDGTTSTLVLLQDIFNSSHLSIQAGSNPTFIKEGMKIALDRILKLLDEQSEKIDINSDRLHQIATISANNDEEIANLVVDAIRKAGINGQLNIVNSHNHTTYIKEYLGFTFNSGYVSSHFLPSESNSVEYENALVYISDEELNKNDVIQLLQKASNTQKPIVFIAPDFNETIMNILIKNHLNGIVKICAVKSPGFASNRRLLLEDLAIYVNTEVKSKILGECDKIIIHRDKTSVIVNNINDKCTARIKDLETLLTDTSLEEVDVDIINNRLGYLNGNVVNIHVGSTTELELNEKKDRIEDAVCAVKAALKEGISEGGGKTFINIFKKMDELKSRDKDVIKGYDNVKNALLTPFVQLCYNSDVDVKNLEIAMHSKEGMNFKTLKFEIMKDAGIIDATKVLKSAISNAVDIASNLLTTKGILNNLWR